ncbi:mucin-2-like isoform X2 [Liolophura sinensis]|uniref:mucin-2-like isoform X2 n=1 Tax=Liolophura sinensis TaxID=3198878 RepID=UPI00315812A3
MEFYRCLLVACLLSAHCALTQGKVSDACHGSSNLNQTYNVLKCEAGTQICITEVRVYTKQGCQPVQYFTPAPPECCRHDPNECSEVISSPGLQNICDGRNQCRVQSPSSKVIITPCPRGFNIQSSVRSVTYRCSSSGSCSETDSNTTTTTRSPNGSSTTIVPPKESPENKPAGKISDACHGSSSLNQTYNVLKCEAGSQICITEVRVYTKQGCQPVQYFTPALPECCRHDPNECSEVISSPGLQNICDGRNQCRVQSPSSKVIITPCPRGFNIQSSVRSISYRCSSSETASETTTTTTTTRSPNRSSTTIAAPKETPRNNPADKATTTTQSNGSGSETKPVTITTASPSKNSATITSSTETSGNRPADTSSATTQVNDPPLSNTPVDYTGVIIGCVVAGIVLVIGIVAFIFLSRRWKAKPRENAQRGDHPTYLSPSNPSTPANALTNDPYPNLPIAPSAPPPNRGSYLSLHCQPNNTSYINLNQDGGYMAPQANMSFAGDISMNEDPEYVEAF